MKDFLSLPYSKLWMKLSSQILLNKYGRERPAYKLVINFDKFILQETKKRIYTIGMTSM